MADKFKMVNDKLVKLTSEDISQLEKDEEENKKILEQEKKQQAYKESATTKLKNLGLTDDEINALIGV
tara:strand:+ start:498 stop:701 length:204 start_codon:yes stop_codon:yes gene_type:complete